MTARDARIELIDALSTIDGIRSAPQRIPEGANPFPFAVAHLSTGTFQLDAASLKVGLHDIMIELHVQRQNLPYDYDEIEPLVDECASAWLTKLKNKGNANGFSSMHHFEAISYTLETGEWAGIETLMIVFVIEQCKVQDDV